MQIEAFAACDIGLHRETNEDRYLVDDELNLLAVSDGMGGHAAGEVAASRSLEIAAEFLRERGPVARIAQGSPDGYFRVLQLAEDAVEEASRRLYREATNDSQLAGMGATLTMLLVVDDKGIMAHVGDSRLYLLRDGRLHLLSSDHTMANELRQAGVLTREQADKSSYSHVLTRSVGSQEAVQSESLLFDLLPGDVCLVCSDGLSNYFENDKEVSRLLSSEDLDEVPQRLVELAKSRGGGDNITAIVARVSPRSAEKAADADELRRCLDAMKSVFLFRGLSLSRLTRVMNITIIGDYQPGQSVISEGDECQGMFVVLGGSFSVASDSGRTDELRTGQWFGAAALLHNQESRATIVAKETSRMMYIAGADFDRLTQRQPRLGRRLLRGLSQHLSEELNRLAINDFSLTDTVDWEIPESK